MNYLFCADLHITDKTPRYRTDEYPLTGLSKLEWIVELANAIDSTLCIAGDFFDSPTVGYEIVNKVIEILNTCKVEPIVIAGQHDMVKKLQDMTSTPLYNLWISGIVRIVGSSVAPVYGIQGQQYGTDLPEYTQGTPILMVHRSITPEEPPFFLGDAISAEEASLIYKDYKIVVAGDYHSPFYKIINGVHIINCGPMLRAEKDKRDLLPCVWNVMISGDKITVTEIKVPIKPAEEVFDIQAIEYDETNSFSLDTSRLKELIDEGVEELDFKQIVWSVFKNQKFSYLIADDVSNLLVGV